MPKTLGETSPGCSAFIHSFTLENSCSVSVAPWNITLAETVRGLQKLWDKVVASTRIKECHPREALQPSLAIAETVTHKSWIFSEKKQRSFASLPTNLQNTSIKPCQSTTGNSLLALLPWRRTLFPWQKFLQNNLLPESFLILHGPWGSSLTSSTPWVYLFHYQVLSEYPDSGDEQQRVGCIRGSVWIRRDSAYITPGPIPDIQNPYPQAPIYLANSQWIASKALILSQSPPKCCQVFWRKNRISKSHGLVSHRDTTTSCDILRLLVAAVVPSLTALKPWELGQLMGSLS